MKTGWTVWTTREDRTSHSSPTLPVGGNELSITVTSSQLVSEIISVVQKTQQLWTNPERLWLEGFTRLLFLLLSFSPLHSAYLYIYWLNLLILFYSFFVNPFFERTSRQNNFLILHCSPWCLELWCDQLLCNVPSKTGASPVACCALTCVGPAKL